MDFIDCAIAVLYASIIRLAASVMFSTIVPEKNEGDMFGADGND